jgi:hypothetical protein
MQKQIKQSPTNPHGLKYGDIVKLPPRKDGFPHRLGDDALWMVLSIDSAGVLYLQHTWADERCGSFADAVIPYMTDHVMP